MLAVAYVVFYMTASPDLKRKAWPYQVVGAGLLFLMFVSLLMGVNGFLFFVLPVGLISFLNLKTVRFCPKCGAYNQGWISRFCIKCRTALTGSAASDTKKQVG